MRSDIVTVIGAVLTTILGGGLVKGVLDYLRDRRRADADYAVSTFSTLKEMNDRLKAEVVELQAQLDEERRRRRNLEDRVAKLERGERGTS